MYLNTRFEAEAYFKPSNMSKTEHIAKKVIAEKALTIFVKSSVFDVLNTPLWNDEASNYARSYKFSNWVSDTEVAIRGALLKNVFLQIRNNDKKTAVLEFFSKKETPI